MIRLGLRLTLGGGREAAVRLAVTAAAVALGVALLLLTLAGINATGKQNSRYAWLNTGLAAAASHPADAANDPVWWLVRADEFDGATVARVDVAATGPTSPVPPGIPRLPGPGEYYASPELAELLRATPSDELGARYPGALAGTIGTAALPAPDSLVVVVGHSAAELASAPGAHQVTAIGTTPPSDCDGCPVGFNSDAFKLILAVAAAALIFPILILIGTATRLAAARREQRFAAMRLVGATPRQISVVSAVESTAAATAGVAVGFGLFLLFREPVAAYPFTGEPFFAADLTLTWTDVLLVAVGVPAAAALSARIALRRVRISPLGVSRRTTPPPPRWYRVVPLALGVAELAYFVGRRPDSTNGQITAYLTGFVVIMAGLIIAGPWLTMAGARFIARRTDRPAVLIAGRRLADNPRAGFRAVSGLVLALFVTTTAVAIISTMVANDRRPDRAAGVDDALVGDYADGRNGTGAPNRSAGPIPDAVTAGLRALPGVHGVLLVHTNPLGTQAAFQDGQSILAGLVSCARLTELAGFGSCAPGAEVASVLPDLAGWDDTRDRVWPATAISADALRGLPVQQVVIGTDGSRAAVERARTELTAAVPYPVRLPSTIGEQDAWGSRDLAGQKQLANVVILVSFPIAACSLAVSVAAGLSDRKRPFSMLRLAGVPLAMLRRVVALESAVPLLAGAVAATGTGFLASQLFARSQLGYSLHAPGTGYYVTVAAGLLAALAIICSTLPLLKRVTGPETARNE